MYIKIRPMSGGSEAVLTVSKLTKIEDVRQMVHEKLDVPAERQRLFFQGKQLEDGHALYDYNVNINDVIQLMVRQALPELPSKSSSKQSSATELKSTAKTDINTAELVEASKYYKVGDLVDACHDGCWWEAKILKITHALTLNNGQAGQEDDGLCYHVEFERYNYELASEVRLHQVRPRAHKKLELDELKAGNKILVNYNIDEPLERGFWYHAKVESVVTEGRRRTLVVSLHCQDEWLSGCIIAFTDELMEIPDHVRLKDRQELEPLTRVSAPSCGSCHDNPRRKCRECGCCKCGGKQDPEKQLMCDECDKPYHIYCLQPPLEAIPDVEEWFCPDCKNDETEIVQAGEKVKESKKKAKMVSRTTNSNRDWGKGYACAGRTKQCTIVPSDHYGPIPGIEVGTQWLYRIQASEAGVHRPPVSGIHGRGDAGAYSIVLSGGYEDDEDNGESFTYTGAGGRDLSGNKRTAEQSCDQTLTSTNRALALNTNCKLCPTGGDAGDKWQGGKPLRVIRSYKGRKHSKYAPEEGIRYDGLYKVCKYWLETGKSGFKVWRYMMKRDDPIPAPWTKEGQKRINELGLVMQYPPEKEHENAAAEAATKRTPKTPKGQRGQKRKNKEENDQEEEDTKEEEGGEKGSSSKRARLCSSSSGYKVPAGVKEAIEADGLNSKLWTECIAAAAAGYQSFVRSVETEFSCVCCQELLMHPVTTPCQHSVCSDCLKRSFKVQESPGRGGADEPGARETPTPTHLGAAGCRG